MGQIKTSQIKTIWIYTDWNVFVLKYMKDLIASSLVLWKKYLAWGRLTTLPITCISWIRMFIEEIQLTFGIKSLTFDGQLHTT